MQRSLALLKGGSTYTPLNVTCDEMKGYPMNTDIKYRFWEFIIYPESLPSDWKDILKDTGLPIAISPLHDKDTVTEHDMIIDKERHSGYKIGDLKKSHYHVLVVYRNPTTKNCVFKTFCEPLNTKRLMGFSGIKKRYEYLIHLNEIDKFHYDVMDIQTINEFNLKDFIELTSSEKDEIIKLIIMQIWQTHIVEYSQLVDFYINDYDKFKLIREYCFFFKNYLNSVRYKTKTADEVIADYESNKLFVKD